MSPSQGAVTTILFTDLVGSTELLQRIGDERAQGVFQAHHRLLERTVNDSGGDPIEWTGDGVMAAFSSPADAVRCAIAVQRAASRDGSDESVQVRVGLNVGEILRQETGSTYFGTPLVVARRLCDSAEAGQILCSGTVRALLAGRRVFRFRSLGSVQLKGIVEATEVHEVAYAPSERGPIGANALLRLIQALPIIVIATDAASLVTFCSDGAREKLGYTPEELVGQLVARLYPSPDEARAVMAAMRDPQRGGAGRVESFPTTFVTKDGRLLPVAISGVIVHDASSAERGTIGVATDLTPPSPQD